MCTATVDLGLVGAASLGTQQGWVCFRATGLCPEDASWLQEDKTGMVNGVLCTSCRF